MKFETANVVYLFRRIFYLFVCGNCDVRKKLLLCVTAYMEIVLVSLLFACLALRLPTNISNQLMFYLFTVPLNKH